jgi:hypothetical protein
MVLHGESRTQVARARPDPPRREIPGKHRYEEFDDDHSDVDYRMDVSLPFLYRALKP